MRSRFRCFSVCAGTSRQPARPNGTWCDGDIIRAAREKHNASALTLRIYCDILRSSDGSFGSWFEHAPRLVSESDDDTWSRSADVKAKQVPFCKSVGMMLIK